MSSVLDSVVLLEIRLLSVSSALESVVLLVASTFVDIVVWFEVCIFNTFERVTLVDNSSSMA